MGLKESKDSFDFQKYGLSEKRTNSLRQYFNRATDHTHKLSYIRFKSFYKLLNPNKNESMANEEAKQAFKEADTNNDGWVGFDEFAAYYILQTTRISNPNIIKKTVKIENNKDDENKNSLEDNKVSEDQINENEEIEESQANLSLMSELIEQFRLVLSYLCI